MKKVFILGSLNMDLVIQSPVEVKQGQTVMGHGFMTNGGGKGANQAAAAGKLGAKILMGGAVGTDAFGQTLTDTLGGWGVDVSLVRKIEGTPTGVAVIVIVDGDNRIILDAGANGCVGEDDVRRLLENAEPGDILLTQLENPTTTVGFALKLAKEKGLVTVLNPAPIDRGILPYLPYADCVIPNETEFAVLAGTEDLEAGAKRILDMGVSDVIVTLGSRGYRYFGKEGTFGEPCIKVKVIDTTAAGDTFCGAFVTALSKEESVKDALRFANRAAALTVTKAGAGQAIPTLAEYDAYYNH